MVAGGRSVWWQGTRSESGTGGRQTVLCLRPSATLTRLSLGPAAQAVLRMLNQPSAIERLPEGMRVKDQTNEERGSGCVTAVKMTMEDRMGGSVNGSIEVTFDCGEVHEYSNEVRLQPPAPAITAPLCAPRQRRALDRLPTSHRPSPSSAKTSSGRLLGMAAGE